VDARSCLVQDLSSSRYRNQLVERSYRIGACKSLFVDSVETPMVEKKNKSKIQAYSSWDDFKRQNFDATR